MTTRTDTNQILVQVCALLLPGSAVQAGEMPSGDWREVVQHAKQQGVASLLYAALQSKGWQNRLPPEIVQDLRLEHIRTDVATWQLYRELYRILEMCEREKIPVVVLKGCALGLTLYANPNLRSLGDIDLLIPRERLGRLSECLIADGYSVYLDLNAGFRETFASEQCFTRKGKNSSTVDVHWHLINIPYYREHIPIQWFWDRVTRFDYEGHTIPVLAPEAQLMHLAFHLMYHHQGNGLRWSFDIALLLSRQGSQMNWDEVLRSARAFGLTQVLRATLTQVRDTWGIAPDGLDWARLKTHIGEKVAFAMMTAPRGEARAVWDGLSTPGYRAKLSYVAQLFFPDSKFMLTRYRIKDPRRLPLYYFLRFGLALKRFVISGGSMFSNAFRALGRTRHV